MSEKIRHTAGPDCARECIHPGLGRQRECASRFRHPEVACSCGCHSPELARIAITAPHDCDVEGCPGRENKRRLEEVNAVTGAPGFSRMESGGEWLEQQRRLEAYPALVAENERLKAGRAEVYPCPECGEPVLKSRLRCQDCLCDQRDKAMQDRDDVLATNALLVEALEDLRDEAYACMDEDQPPESRLNAILTKLARLADAARCEALRKAGEHE